MWLFLFGGIFLRIAIIIYQSESMRRHADTIEAKDDHDSIHAVPLAIKKRFGVGRWEGQELEAYNADIEGAEVEQEYIDGKHKLHKPHTAKALS